MNRIKSRMRSRLTNDHLHALLRSATMKLDIDIRGVPDQDFQNPAGTGFTGYFHRIRPDYPAGFYRIIRPLPDFSVTKSFKIHPRKYQARRTKRKCYEYTLQSACLVMTSTSFSNLFSKRNTFSERPVSSQWNFRVGEILHNIKSLIPKFKFKTSSKEWRSCFSCIITWDDANFWNHNLWFVLKFDCCLGR